MSRRLSSLDMLPEVAQGELAWAYDALHARRQTQQDILEDLNRRLSHCGVAAVAMSTFNRWAVKVLSGGLKRPVPPAERQAATSISLQPATLRLLATAFRMLADDLDEAAQ